MSTGLIAGILTLNDSGTSYHYTQCVRLVFRTSIFNLGVSLSYWASTPNAGNPPVHRPHRDLLLRIYWVAVVEFLGPAFDPSFWTDISEYLRATLFVSRICGSQL